MTKKRSKVTTIKDNSGQCVHDKITGGGMIIKFRSAEDRSIVGRAL